MDFNVDPMDFREASDMIQTVLTEKGLYSESAVKLLLGTMAVESDFGKFTRQIGGPALGIFQMEKPTFEWLKEKYSDEYGLSRYSFEMLETNNKLAVLFARLRYLVAPDDLPKESDIKGLAEYWKKHYNTPKGKGKTTDFISKFKTYYQSFLNCKN